MLADLVRDESQDRRHDEGLEPGVHVLQEGVGTPPGGGTGVKLPGRALAAANRMGSARRSAVPLRTRNLGVNNALLRLAFGLLGHAIGPQSRSHVCVLRPALME